VSAQDLPKVDTRKLGEGYLLACVGKGGSKWHLVPRTPCAKRNDQGQPIALCGYSPRGSSSQRMVNRAGWWVKNAEDTRLVRIPWCEACQSARHAFDTALQLAEAEEANA